MRPTNRSRLIALAATLLIGILVGAVIQRTVGFGNLLRTLGVPYDRSAPATGLPIQPFEVAAEHRGRMALVILAGQSNMVGWAPVPPDELDRSHVRVYAFGNDYRWRLATEPVDDARGQVDRVSEDRAAGFGPSLAFGLRSVARDEDLVVGLIPCAKAASTIEEWAPDLSDQSLYGSCLKRARAASVMGELVGFLFLQGEADALDAARDPLRNLRAADWSFRFTTLVGALREDLGAPELPVVYAQIGSTTARDAFTQWEIVKGQQASVRLDHTAMIVTEDLPLLDGLHFTVESYRIIGQRFADALWRLVRR